MRIALFAALAVLILTTAVPAIAQSGGWYVVTYSGQRVLGPFVLLNECQYWAELLARRYYNISPVCQYKTW